ncbi:glycosyl hydrolase family 65, partial [Klebsiella pneumoniae]
INYRGRLIKVAVGKENVVFTLLKGEPLDLQVYGKDITLDGSHTVALEK